MKVGDLVTVRPSRHGLYLIVEKDRFDTEPKGSYWLLWNWECPCVSMSEEWIDVVVEI